MRCCFLRPGQEQLSVNDQETNPSAARFLGSLRYTATLREGTLNQLSSDGSKMRLKDALLPSLSNAKSELSYIRIIESFR